MDIKEEAEKISDIVIKNIKDYLDKNIIKDDKVGKFIYTEFTYFDKYNTSFTDWLNKKAHEDYELVSVDNNLFGNKTCIFRRKY